MPVTLQRPQWLIGSFALSLTLLAAPQLRMAEAEVSLSPERAQWTELVFLDGLQGLIASGQAASFAFGDDPKLGGTISVGPWSAGSWGARLEYKKAFPSPEGTINGYYRTTDLLPFQAGVTIVFLQGEQILAKKSYSLAPSPAWRPFTVSVGLPPAGADSFRAAFGLSDKSAGRVDFARLTIAKGSTPLVFPADPTAVTRPSPPAAFSAGAKFRLASEAGTSWLVTPAGRPFYSVATVGPSGRAEDHPVRTGDQWAAYLRAFGFNSLAGWTRVSFWSGVNTALESAGAEPLPLFVAVASESLAAPFDLLVDAQGNTGRTGHAFPDPFDPDFEAAYRAKVIDLYRYLEGKSWFAGWFADNELDHDQLPRQVYSPHCAVALKAFLVSRHGSIAALNRAWSTNYPSFDALIAARPDPILPLGAMAEDYRVFAREIVGRYIEVTLRVIRSVDPGRLVFSNRFTASGLGGVSPLLDLYAAYDGIAVNLYPGNQQPGLSANEKAFLQHVHDRTGKPVLVTEWSVPAIDSGLYDGLPSGLDWSWNQALATQGDRGRQAAALTADFYNLPFLVGAQWYTWKDLRAERSANRGLLSADGLPWEELLQQLHLAGKRLVP